MDWLRDNWLWIAVVGFFLWMHMGMHGSHGGHGGHGGGGCCGGGGHRHGSDDARAQGQEPSQREQEDPHAGHRHGGQHAGH